eukprot:272622-Chlamydomonas_euryale.AAC.1
MGAPASAATRFCLRSRRSIARVSGPIIGAPGAALIARRGVTSCSDTSAASSTTPRGSIDVASSATSAPASPRPPDGSPLLTDSANEIGCAAEGGMVERCCAEPSAGGDVGCETRHGNPVPRILACRCMLHASHGAAAATMPWQRGCAPLVGDAAAPYSLPPLTARGGVRSAPSSSELCTWPSAACGNKVGELSQAAAACGRITSAAAGGSGSGMGGRGAHAAGKVRRGCRCGGLRARAAPPTSLRERTAAACSRRRPGAGGP